MWHSYSILEQTNHSYLFSPDKFKKGSHFIYIKIKPNSEFSFLRQKLKQAPKGISSPSQDLSSVANRPFNNYF